MDDLRDAGYQTILPDDIRRASRGWGWLPPKPVVITFDDGYYDLTERTNQFINEIVLGKIAPQSRISIVISHDQMLYPLAVFAANKQIDMRFYGDTKNWLNFLAGIAVIVKPDNTTKIVLLKGLDTGYQD